MADSGNTPDDESTNRIRQSVLREFGPYFTLGFQLAAPAVIFALLGSWADSAWDTTPYLTLVGALVGASGGMIKFIRTVMQTPDKPNTKKSDETRL